MFFWTGQQTNSDSKKPLIWWQSDFWDKTLRKVCSLETQWNAVDGEVERWLKAVLWGIGRYENQVAWESPGTESKYLELPNHGEFFFSFLEQSSQEPLGLRAIVCVGLGVSTRSHYLDDLPGTLALWKLELNTERLLFGSFSPQYPYLWPLEIQFIFVKLLFND